MMTPSIEHIGTWMRRIMDQASAKRVHLNVPKVGHHLAIPAAGRASNMPVEGAAMDWYERVRGQELQVPHTAR